MTTQTLQPRHHLSGRQGALGLAGAVLLMGAGYGVLAWVSDEGRVAAPGQDLASTVNTEELDQLR